LHTSVAKMDETKNSLESASLPARVRYILQRIKHASPANYMREACCVKLGGKKKIFRRFQGNHP